MYGDRTSNVIRLQRYPGGVAAGLRTRLCNGRYEIVTAGPNPEFGFIGSDPYGTNAYTGLVVPTTPSSAIGGARYLFLLARASFQTGEQSSDNVGTHLVGIRQYAELIARIPAGTAPLASEGGPPVGSTVVFRQEIEQPLWHPLDGDISWHVMLTNRSRRDMRNPANTDGVVFQTSNSPTLLFQTLAPYTPPNGGRPWGTPVQGLGNMHALMYRFRDEDAEYALRIPVVPPCDISLFASVRQNNPATNPTLANSAATQQFFALSKEDKFVVAYSQFAQYGVIVGSLVFEESVGEDVP
jgi:hypothetical protein